MDIILISCQPYVSDICTDISCTSVCDSSTVPPTGHHQLLASAQQFLEAGLVTSTMTTYSAGKQRYVKFCNMATIRVTLASESTLILFATDLATTGISHASIKVYLSAVWHMHVMRGNSTSSLHRASPYPKGYQNTTSIHSPSKN